MFSAIQWQEWQIGHVLSYKFSPRKIIQSLGQRWKTTGITREGSRNFTVESQLLGSTSWGGRVWWCSIYRTSDRAYLLIPGWSPTDHENCSIRDSSTVILAPSYNGMSTVEPLYTVMSMTYKDCSALSEPEISSAPCVSKINHECSQADLQDCRCILKHVNLSNHSHGLKPTCAYTEGNLGKQHTHNSLQHASNAKR